MLSGMSQSSHESRRRPPPLRRYSVTPSLFRAGRMNSDRSILSEASSSRSVLAMTILEILSVLGDPNHTGRKSATDISYSNKNDEKLRDEIRAAAPGISRKSPSPSLSSCYGSDSEIVGAVAATQVAATQGESAEIAAPPPSGPCPGSTFNVKVLLRSFSAWNLPLT